MTDIKLWISRIEEANPPDQWSEIAEAIVREQDTSSVSRSEPPHLPHRRPPSRRTKVVVIMTAFVLTIVATGLVVFAFRSATPTAPATPAPLRTNGDIWAFVGGGDGGSAVYRVDPRSGAPSVLWSDDRGWPGAPPDRVKPSAVSMDYDFSPDGSRVVFSSYGYDGDRRPYGTELFVMDADGTNIHQLTHDHAVNGFPAWSPDGSSIVFASYRGSGYVPGCLGLSICLPDLYAIDANGGQPRQLTNDPLGETAPRWSPDGSRLVFVSVTPEGNGSLEIMNVDGGQRTPITSDPDVALLFPEWSPDGQRILFLRAAQGERFHLWTVFPDGSDQRDLLDTRADTTFGRPLWSPDGGHIAYGRLVGGEAELWLVDPDGTNDHRLATWPRYGGAPVAWQPIATETDGHPISVSAEDTTHALRCSASFPSSVVAPGEPTAVQMRLQNISPDPLTLRVGINGDYGALLIRDGSGALVQDTYQSHAGILGPAPMPEIMAPGGSISVGVDGTVLWPGPLQVTGYCSAFGFRRIVLPEVALQVLVQGDAPSATEATTEAIQAAAPVFDGCTPAPGVPVVGTVPSRIDGDGPTIEVRCEVSVIPADGFDLVVLAVIAPPEAKAQDLRPLAYDIAAVPQMELKGPVAVSWWVYVVTADRTIQVRQRTVAINCGDTSMSSGSGISSCPAP